MVRAQFGPMSEQSTELKARTEAFAVAVVKFCDTLPSSAAGRRIGQQVLDSATSVAANYRAACRTYTDRLYISKIAIVDEEADETEFWFRIIRKAGLKSSESVAAARTGGTRTGLHFQRFFEDSPGEFSKAARSKIPKTLFIVSVSYSVNLRICESANSGYSLSPRRVSLFKTLRPVDR